MTIKLSDLTALLGYGWSTDWVPILDEEGETLIGFDHADNAHAAPEGLIDIDSPDYGKALGDFIAASVNALPALVEIAKAALELRDAHAALDATERSMVYVGIVSADQLLGIDTIRDAKVAVNAAGDALLAALSKVAP